MSERVEAAAKTFLGFTPEDRADALEREINAACRSKAKKILTAADAVMFSDESIDRAAAAAFFQDDLGGHVRGHWTWATIPEEGRNNYRTMVRAVLTAVLGEDS